MKDLITESRLWEYFNGELTAREKEEVRAWADADEENRALFGDVQQQYLRMRWASEAPQIRGGYTNIADRVGKAKSNARRRLIAAISIPAAAAVAILTLLVFPTGEPAGLISQISLPATKAIVELSDGSQHVVTLDESVLTETDGTRLSINNGEIAYPDNVGDPAGKVIYNKVTVPRGADRYRVRLGDGSIIWLNSDSRLEYPLSFSGAERKVNLTGEAYFEVARDENKPFVVVSGQQSVTVLGTEFNVSAYSDGDIVTTLVAGKVMVDPGRDGQVILSPGEQAAYSVDTGSTTVGNVDVRNFISWKDGEISIEKIPFEQILAKLSRRFDVDFELADNDFSDVILKGSFPEGENFETILSMLAKAGNVEFKPNKYGIIKVDKR